MTPAAIRYPHRVALLGAWRRPAWGVHLVVCPLEVARPACPLEAVCRRLRVCLLPAGCPLKVPDKQR